MFWIVLIARKVLVDAKFSRAKESPFVRRNPLPHAHGRCEFPNGKAIFINPSLNFLSLKLD